MPPIVNTFAMRPVKVKTDDGKEHSMILMSLYTSEIPSQAYLIGEALILPQHLVSMAETLKKMKEDSPELFAGTEVKTVKEVKSLKEMFDDIHKDQKGGKYL